MNNSIEINTPEEKKIDLFLQQKQTLDSFIERGAITKAQYDKSLGDLIMKMGINDLASVIEESEGK